MARCSLLSVLRSKNDWPHSLMGLGNLDVSASAAGERSDGDTDVPTNGVRSGMVRPELHAGEVIVEKSPASIAVVGTNWKKLGGPPLTRVPRSRRKKKILPGTTGPPSVPPN